VEDMLLAKEDVNFVKYSFNGKVSIVLAVIVNYDVDLGVERERKNINYKLLPNLFQF
jgi:hypothetical protein